MANKILVTGATGYIGGTVLETLITSTEPSLSALTFDLLVRREEQAERLRDKYGARINPMLWKGLDDTDFIADTASQYDIVINASSGFNPAGAQAFIHGLARRLGGHHPIPWFFSIAGCTNIADRPLTDEAFPDRIWDDADGKAIYDYMKTADEKDPYPQRSAEIGVLDALERTGVQGVSINIPCIFGEGTGLFNKQGLIVPITIRQVVENGFGYKLNDTGNFDWVHVQDLADLYVILIRAVLEREDRAVGYIPTGHKGIIFPAVGRVLHVDIMRLALDAAFDAGVLPRKDTPKEKEILLLSLQQVAGGVAGPEKVAMQIAEQGIAGHKKMKASNAARLGWEPKRLEEAWRQDFKDELNAYLEGRRGDTMANCIDAA